MRVSLTSDPDFYDRTAAWWGRPRISALDRERARQLHALAGGPHRVLEIGAGFGGTAAATADLGHSVLAIERSPVRVALARQHLTAARRPRLRFLEADFLTVQLSVQCDVVAYWRGFGVGDEPKHAVLLERIRAWLRPGGVAVLDVFDPAWWRIHAGQTKVVEGFGQRLGFDGAASRLLVTCWPEQRPDLATTESIRCYSSREAVAVAARAGLRLLEEPDDVSGADVSFQLRLTR